MWSVITKFFTKPDTKLNEQSGVVNVLSGVGMNRTDTTTTDDRRPDMDLQDSYDTRQAKQRASVKWLLSKAFNNKVPENLREPFYRDHENQEHLKPQIVRSLANAELYCLALGNIYSDPNYHNLNHWSILQTLSRKGIYVNEPADAQLTETVLIQTNPLRMSAHMAVIESMMNLYAKEVVSPDRVLAAVQRFNFSGSNAPTTETLLGECSSLQTPLDHEQGLLLWVSHACSALKKRIEQELEQNTTSVESTDSRGGNSHHAPDLPPVKDLKDLCDGVGLAALISFYCPDELPWSQLLVSYLPTVSESLHNLMLVYHFCERSLPFSVFHMMPEDVTYMRGSMKQNLIVFLADMFNVLEIHPVKCVRYPGMDKTTNVSRSPAAVHMTVRKTQSLQQSVSEFSEDSLRRGSEDSFVVHRGRAVPTLSSVLQAEEPLLPARTRPAKEKQNNDTKAEERGDGRATAAGKPSNWEESRKTTYAGRRSRRNSTSDDSQLTIENFGGSQEHLNFIGRNPDKEVAVHVGRKISAPAAVVTPPFEVSVAVRSSIQDARGTLQIGYDSDSEKQDRAEKDSYNKLKLKRQLSNDAISPHKNHTFQNHSTSITNANTNTKGSSDLINDIVDGEVANKMASFADLSNKKMLSGGGGGDQQKAIQLVYMNYDKEDNMPSKSSFLNKKNGNGNTNGEKKTTTFATLPNTTTWQQQSSNQHQQMDNSHGGDDGSGSGGVMASQLNDIRMKLEEKRRHIENEKRKMEIIMSKQRQKVGKAAFLQAVTKEISEDAMSVEHKWLDQDGGAPFVETRKTPDIESMDMDQYQQSIAQMNSSLHDIQADIQRLASQQNQIQASQQHAILLEQQKAHLQAIAAAQIQQQQQQQHLLQQQQQQQSHYNPLQSYGSVPHLQYPQMSTSPRIAMDQPQFYLHDQPTPPQRRTWAQHAHAHHNQPPAPISSNQEPLPPPPELRTWGGGGSSTNMKQPMTSNTNSSNSFMLHDTTNDHHHQQQQQQQHMRYQNQNGGGSNSGNYNNHVSYTLSQQHQAAQLFPGTSTSPPLSSGASPQHHRSNNNIHRQISQLMNDTSSDKRIAPVTLSQLNERTTHAPIPTPPVDDMEPQNISFIGNSAADDLSQGIIGKLNITSGTRTYRIPSPTRPAILRNSFQVQHQLLHRDDDDDTSALLPAPPATEVSALDLASTSSNEKGFYISFDNNEPKRPKPPLRMKRMSPKKERSVSAYVGDSDDYSMTSTLMNSHENSVSRHHEQTARERRKQLERELEEERRRQEDREAERLRQDRMRTVMRETTSQDRDREAAIVIGNDLTHPDPTAVDEMEKKKERILLLSLQRRQQQEELKERKEAEAIARREREKAKEEERQRKKEEQAARRAAILEQHKLKKAIEEAEREGKVLDKSEFGGGGGTMKSGPKMRSKTTLSRPRPKTIHVDSGSVEMAEGMLQPSTGKKGSSTNLIANSYTPTCSSTMRRDYYRGSQDSLADRGMGSGILYRDSPDDSRGMSPCRSTNPSLGRRSSYKTSREVQEPGQIRGRPKYPTYQNFKGRKSNSLMNLCGSSSDQDSMAYRYGDTDSGLGRATPPRRAPSPGMGPMRHLPSPSGPGSLPPGLMTKRRIFDDGSSDISSTPSSMMDYSGPRLYKQPATKSNRGIMLNAVEYCVFPGVVNKEAKQRVLEEIARSESKHFLILFRDAGCQFRALYSYCPDREEVLKLYGTGPKQVNDRMFDKFFKYNSGGKCFSQVHTKHLTVTIDAFTIHNSLWQGKKVNLPNKKDMALVI